MLKHFIFNRFSTRILDTFNINNQIINMLKHNTQSKVLSLLFILN